MKLYQNADYPSDIVNIEQIIKRYMEINETLDGFGAYLESNFCNDLGYSEYVYIGEIDLPFPEPQF